MTEKKQLSDEMKAVFRAKRRAKWHQRIPYDRSHGPVEVRSVDDPAPEAPERTNRLWWILRLAVSSMGPSQD